MGSSRTPFAFACSTTSAMIRSASDRTSLRAASSPSESPLIAPNVEMAQFIASLLQRAPWRLRVTCTGKA